jgi:cytochrome c oxidase cbb3-type subunit 3
MSTPRIVWLLGVLLCSELSYAQLPDGPHREAALKLCGTCHSANIVLGRGMTRDQWGEMVSNMISKGAKGTPDEFNQVVEYLATALPAKGATPNPTRRRPSGGLSAGPMDRQVADPDAANRGKTIYFKECITCHGPKARGANLNAAEGQKGTDLVRSLVILHDRYGNQLGPFMKKGHPMQSSVASSSLTGAQIQDLANFLHQRFEDTLHREPFSKPLNVLTGDANAGKSYFNGEGTCSTCHSPTGDLAHIAGKYDPPTLQLKFLFPRMARFGPGGAASTPKPVMATVSQPDGPSVTGELLRIDDFTISLRDAEGQYRSWTRTPELKVQKSDPYDAHNALLDRYTDKNMHDIVAYLETLK